MSVMRGTPYDINGFEFSKCDVAERPQGLTPLFLEIYDKFIASNRACICGGTYYAWSSTWSCWVDVMSEDFGKEMCDGLELNAPVNYLKAASTYVAFIIRHTSMRIGFTSSICLGHERYLLSRSDDGVYKFSPALGTVGGSSGSGDTESSFCVAPVSTSIVPKTWVKKDAGAIGSYISNVIPDDTDMMTLMWIIGNCVLDPVEEHRILMMYGPGGAGKSRISTILESVMGNACTVINCSAISDMRLKTVPDNIVLSLVSSRLVLGGDVQLDRGLMNMQVLKVITGNDFLPHPVYPKGKIIARSSMLFSTNTMPSKDANKEWATSAVMRRVVILPLYVDARRLGISGGLFDDKDSMQFLMECVSVCFENPSMPISARTVLHTVLASDITIAERYVTYCGDATYIQCTAATRTICKKLSMTCEEITRWASEVSPTSVITGILGSAIKGIMPK